MLSFPMLQYTIERELKQYRTVDRRFDQWLKTRRSNFSWTEENVRRFFAVNDVIIEKENALYRTLSQVKADLDQLLANGKSYYKYYDIDAYLSYEAEEFAPAWQRKHDARCLLLHKIRILQFLARLCG